MVNTSQLTSQSQAWPDAPKAQRRRGAKRLGEKK
jgi:hypothetical protein